MSRQPREPGLPITADTPVLEVIYHHRATEAVFKRYEERTGHCICCEALFETVREVAARYGLDMADLLQELEQVAGEA